MNDGVLFLVLSELDKILFSWEREFSATILIILVLLDLGRRGLVPLNTICFSPFTLNLNFLMFS